MNTMMEELMMNDLPLMLAKIVAMLLNMVGVCILVFLKSNSLDAK